jgi:hypothetical protein
MQWSGPQQPDYVPAISRARAVRERRLRFPVHSIAASDIEEKTRGREKLIGHHQIATFIGRQLRISSTASFRRCPCGSG